MAPAFVQSKGGTSNTLSSLPIAFASNNTAGNLLVCSGVVNASTLAGLTITDTQGNLWTIVIVDNWKALSTFFMAYAQNCNAGANTVTIAQLGSLISGAISEYSGVSPAASLDVSGFSDSGSGTWTAATSGNVTTRENGELIVAAQGNSTGPASVTLGSGFSNLQNDSGNFVSIESQVQATAGAITGTFTISASSGACGVLTFVPPADAVPFNVWTPQGNVLPISLVTSATALGNPNVIFDGNPIILPGPNVFKMWAMAKVGTNYTLNYFESADGLTDWTAYASNPIMTSGDPLDPKVFKVAGTFYIYTGQGSAIGLNTSTDGVTLSNQGTVLSVGGAGTWDSISIAQICLLDIIAGTWYAYYTGAGSTGQNYFMGLITSSDGKTWTKSPSNPIIQVVTSNFTFQKVGGTYYGWSQAVVNSALVSSGSNMTWISRFSATNPSGPWTQLKSGSQVIGTYYSAIPTDFSNFFFAEDPLIGSQLGDPSIVQALGNTYIYYDVGFDGVVRGVNAAVATGITVAQLVSTYEGVVGAPISGAPQLNLVTLDSDNFQRANANPIGGSWTALTTPAQLTSNLVEVATAGTNGDSWWNARVYGNDQWAQVTANILVSGSDIGANVRTATGGANTTYKSQWSSGSGSLGSTGTLLIRKVVGGSATTLTTVSGLTVNLNDTISLVVNGTNIYAYWNTFLIGSATDSAISSGAPGFELFGVSVANAAISAWSGGTFQDAPLLSASISGNAGVGGATVSYSGTSSGSVVADSFGNYILPNLVNGSYTITPSLAGYTFSPSSSSQTVSGTNITGVNFTAAQIPVGSHYSVPDARNYGNFPNLSTNVNGTLTYTVPAEYSLQYWFDILFNRTQPLPEDSRAAGKPVASGTYPQNSRAPGTYGPGE